MKHVKLRLVSWIQMNPAPSAPQHEVLKLEHSEVPDRVADCSPGQEKFMAQTRTESHENHQNISKHNQGELHYRRCSTVEMDAAANACEWFKCIDLRRNVRPSSVLHRVCRVSKTKIDLERRQANASLLIKWTDGIQDIQDIQVEVHDYHDLCRESFVILHSFCKYAFPRISHWDPVLSCRSECCCSDMFSIQRDSSCSDPQFWCRSESFSIQGSARNSPCSNSHLSLDQSCCAALREDLQGLVKEPQAIRNG